MKRTFVLLILTGLAATLTSSCTSIEMSLLCNLPTFATAYGCEKYFTSQGNHNERSSYTYAGEKDESPSQTPEILIKSDTNSDDTVERLLNAIRTNARVILEINHDTNLENNKSPFVKICTERRITADFSRITVKITEEVSSLQGFFFGCTIRKFPQFDIEGKITDISYMYANTVLNDSVPVENFLYSNVRNARRMFYQSKINEPQPEFPFNKDTDVEGLFEGSIINARVTIDSRLPHKNLMNGCVINSEKIIIINGEENCRDLLKNCIINTSPTIEYKWQIKNHDIGKCI